MSELCKALDKFQAEFKACCGTTCDKPAVTDSYAQLFAENQVLKRKLNDLHQENRELWQAITEDYKS